MSGRPVSELLSEYALVLRGTGLTEVGIARLHNAPEPEGDETIHEVLQRQVSGSPTESQLFGRLGKTIVDSARGIESPAEYWNSAPEVHLRELLVPYGLEVSFEPTRYADSIADGQFDIHVTDAEGTSYRTRFEYPESPLGDDNYPALLHQLEEDILSAAGLTFVRLRSPSEQWRFMMLTTDQRDALRNRYGERIEVLGEPLLAEHQPQDFVEEGAIPVPDWYEVETESDSTGPDLDELVQEGADPASVATEVPTEEDIAAPELEDAESEAEIVEAVQPDTPGERTTGPGGPQPASVEASDDEVQSVFGDLSDVSLDKATDGGAAASTPAENGSLALESSGGPSTGTESADDEEPMDELFDEIEREVADQGREAGLGGEDDASIAELLDGEVPDDDPGDPADDPLDGTGRGGLEDLEPTDSATDHASGSRATVSDSAGERSGLDTLSDQDGGAVHDDSAPDDARGGTDTTATELFDRLDRERSNRA